MKKEYLTVFICLSLVISMCACGVNSKNIETSNKDGKNSKSEASEEKKTNEKTENSDNTESSEKNNCTENNESYKFPSTADKSDSYTLSEDIGSSHTKEKTITVRYPIYGEPYTLHWIKNERGEVIFSTKDSDEAREKRLEMIADPDIDPGWTWGSEGKSEIIGYEEVILTESQFKETNWYQNPEAYPEITIVYN